jgi:hypothetical protein
MAAIFGREGVFLVSGKLVLGAEVTSSHQAVTNASVTDRE